MKEMPAYADQLTAGFLQDLAKDSFLLLDTKISRHCIVRHSVKKVGQTVYQVLT